MTSIAAKICVRWSSHLGFRKACGSRNGYIWRRSSRWLPSASLRTWAQSISARCRSSQSRFFSNIASRKISMSPRSIALFSRATLLSARFSSSPFVVDLLALNYRLRSARSVARGDRLRTPSSARSAQFARASSSGIKRSPNDKHIRVIMLARKSRALFIPAKRATHSAHLVRRHRLAVAGTAENNSAIAFAFCHRFRRRPNEKRIVDRFLTPMCRNPSLRDQAKRAIP